MAMASDNWAALAELEEKVEALLSLTETLGTENRALKTQQRSWTTERAKLIEKNEMAKSKVESMISRLKSLEQD
jgi:cell division protein ZapB